jgi:hypothetical protein
MGADRTCTLVHAGETPRVVSRNGVVSVFRGHPVRVVRREDADVVVIMCYAVWTHTPDYEPLNSIATSWARQTVCGPVVFVIEPRVPAQTLRA